MKTKLTKVLLSLLLIAVITATLMLVGGCGGDAEPNFGATGAKSYEPSLSAMSDEAIQRNINHLYDDVARCDWDKATFIAQMITVYQNELILRQLEALNGD